MIYPYCQEKINAKVIKDYKIFKEEYEKSQTNSIDSSEYLFPINE